MLGQSRSDEIVVLVGTYAAGSPTFAPRVQRH